VARALRRLGHQVMFCGVDKDWQVFSLAKKVMRPDLVFNLLEEFSGEALLEPFVPAALEASGCPYTGCSSVPLILAKNKQVTKQMLNACGIKTPGDRHYPKIVKYLEEESSRGISQLSIVQNPQQEKRFVKKLRKKWNAKIFSEEYIEGRELHVAVMPMGNKWQVSPVWETCFGKAPGYKILSEKNKWDFAYRIKVGMRLQKARGLSKEVERLVQNVSQKSAQALGVDGPARVDIRLDKQNVPYVIEVNPNPDLAEFDEYALCMKSLGMTYLDLIQTLCHTGLRRRSYLSRKKSKHRRD
jgi:D-alanine-D-alanine ligase